MAKSVSRNYSLTREILQTHVWMMEPQALSSYRAQLLHNFNGHVLAQDITEDILPAERHCMLCYTKSADKKHTASSVLFFDQANNLVEESAEGDTVAAHEPKEDEERILVLYMDGPVTRYGGMCSQGSVDYRDLLLQYADDDSVKGMVLVTDTPGGTAFALHDFEQGMAAWNDAGKFSVQWIDGMSCSAGVACGSQCQQIVAYNEHDIVGCIGAMMAGWVTADGTVDRDGNRYVDVTATQTPDKNGEVRAAAAGDYEGLQAEVDACCNEFFRILDTCRPQVLAEHRTGKTFEASEVVGSLIDGFASFDDACHYALTGEAAWTTPAANGAAPSASGDSPNAPSDSLTRGLVDSPSAGAEAPTVAAQSQTPNTSYNMNILEKIALALGVNINDETPAQQEEQAAAPESAGAEAPAAESQSPNPQSPESDLNETINLLNAQLAEMTTQMGVLTEARDAAIAERDANAESLTAITAERDAVVAECNELKNLLSDCKTDIEQKEADLASMEAQLTEAQAQIANAEHQLVDTQAQLADTQAQLTEAQTQLEEANAELNEFRTQAPPAPMPAPATPNAEEAHDDTPEDFHEGMTAQELIAIQKKKNARRSRK